MKPKNCLIFGGSGLIGRNLIRKLTQNNFRVTVVTRNIHRKGYSLKTQGNPGYVDVVESNIFDEDKIRNFIKKTDICINLVGILFQKGKVNTFKNIHEKFPEFLARLCNEYKVNQFIHLSALGIEQAKDSLYSTSKMRGELLVRQNYKEATILKPSVIYSVDDNFTTNFMTLLNRFPIFPLYYNGSTLFRPIHVSDMVEIIYQIVNKTIKSKTIECVGQEEISLKNILLKLLKLINKKRLLIPLPFFIARLSALFFEMFPKPLITLDQLRLLKYPNIPSGKYETNFDIKIFSSTKFEDEVEKYSYMWKSEGQFSLAKYKDLN